MRVAHVKFHNDKVSPFLTQHSHLVDELAASSLAHGQLLGLKEVIEGSSVLGHCLLVQVTDEGGLDTQWSQPILVLVLEQRCGGYRTPYLIEEGWHLSIKVS